jgi:F0F1-type ATP synthase membrane subunit c/vacuolar-type H+-ATPase subunit K
VRVQYVVMNPDPGWNLTPRSLLGTLSPFRSLRRTDSDDTELAVLRRLFVSFCLALALVAVVVIVLRDGGDEDAPVGLSVATVVAVGIASLISGRSIGRRLDGSSDAALVASYRSRFFLRLAFAESAALAAFVIAISIGPWWAYFVGLAFTVVGFARLAPTGRNLERDDNDLRAHGCHRSIGRLLNSVSTPTAP